MTKIMTKSVTMLMLVIALSLVTAVVSNGQSTQRVYANVPFNFVAGNKELPAGRYNVAPMTSDGQAVRISGTESSLSVIRLTSTINKTKPSDRTKLVFHRYGNSYFLSEVWCQGNTSGRQFSESSAEKAAARELAQGQKYERIEVAMLRY